MEHIQHHLAGVMKSYGLLAPVLRGQRRIISNTGDEEGFIQIHIHNSMELIWVTMKNWVTEKSVTFKLNDVAELDDEKCVFISKDDWKLRHDHMLTIEDHYMDKESLLEDGGEAVMHFGGDGYGSSASRADCGNAPDKFHGGEPYDLSSICAIASLNTRSMTTSTVMLFCLRFKNLSFFVVAC
jgi:hypothetical protein